MEKTYTITLSRIFKSTGKRINEKIQVDANNCKQAGIKTKTFYRNSHTYEGKGL